MRRTALPSQLLARKSIDKLIRDSEEPEHALKKTLGPWSLTALGIGAVIGSGIFTVIGTAISGEQFDTSSVLNTPLANYLITHTALAGRPGAGPATPMGPATTSRPTVPVASRRMGGIVMASAMRTAAARRVARANIARTVEAKR